MCGISGVVSKGEPAELEKSVEHMCSAIRHRGPDSGGIYVDSHLGVGLGHQRLAIQDVSPAGQQPISSKCARFNMVFNGEIYNFKKIRAELEALGRVFIGHSDTEVLIEAIAKWGIEASLRKIEGMFAFAILDHEKNTLTLCRDRMGEKPLYYGWIEQKFVFSSELGAIEKLTNTLRVSRKALAEYFYYGYVPAPYCIYEGLYKLQPGTYIAFNVHDGVVNEDNFSPNCSGLELSPKQYWSVKSVVSDLDFDNSISENSAIDKLDKLLKDVITDQLTADVPLGAFLSGGIDSTTVVAIMQQLSAMPTQTFTIGFKEKDFNEAGFAKEIGNYLGTNHTELYIGPEKCLELVPEMAHVYDEPIADSSQIPCYLVSQMAKERVTVCLSGDGGDELFAGYNRYFWAEKMWKRMSAMPLTARKILSSILSAIPIYLWDQTYKAMAHLIKESSRQKNIGLKIQKIAEMLDSDDVESAYLHLISYWREDSFPLIDGHDVDKSLFKSAPSNISNFVDKAMYWDQLSYLPGDNLTKVDRASMAHSLETRLPLLNHRVVEYAWQTPQALKLKDGKSKWLLRQVLYKYVPEKLIERPKMGFSVPVGEWIRGPLKGWTEDLIDDMNKDIYNYLVIKDVYQSHMSGKSDHSNRLWALFVFLNWARARNIEL